MFMVTIRVTAIVMSWVTVMVMIRVTVMVRS
jgi:hypothetical protein